MVSLKELAKNFQKNKLVVEVFPFEKLNKTKEAKMKKAVDRYLKFAGESKS